MVLSRLYVFFIGIPILVIICNSCRKDPVIEDPAPEPIDSTYCEELPPYTGWNLGYTINEDSILYESPYFNPNNNNEFIYVRKDNVAGTKTVYKYNMITETNVFIYQGDMYDRPKWGSNNWILLNPTDANVWKIDSDGNNLTQLTNTGTYFYPQWNMSADKFVVSTSSQSNISYVFDESGTPLDTIDFEVDSQSSWQHNNYLITFLYDFIKVIDVNSNSLVASYDVQSGNVLWGSAIWKGDSEVVWSQAQGLFSSNSSFTTVSNFLPSCSTQFYFRGSVNSDKTKIAWQRLDKSLIDEENVFLESRIILMDVDGTNIDTLDLP